MVDEPAETELGQNARFTLEEGAFLFHSVSRSETSSARLGDQVRAALAAGSPVEDPQHYWGFDAHQLLLKLDRLTPPQQQALRAAVAAEARPPAGFDLMRVRAILDTWVNARADHRQREYLRAFFHAVGLPLESP